MKNKIVLDIRKTPEPKVGQFWLNPATEGLFLLSGVGAGEFSLVNLKTGQHWAGTGETPEEAFDGRQECFTLVTSPFTVTPDTE